MFRVFPGIRLFTMVFGNTLNTHKTFLEGLLKILTFCEVASIEKSDFIIAFIVVSSRAGTDVKAAYEKIPKTKPQVLVVLHHTLDIDYLPPDSKRILTDIENVAAVDCLFHEDKGLLGCKQNKKALEEVKDYLNSGHLLMEREADVVPELQGGSVYSSADMGADDESGGLLDGFHSRGHSTSSRAEEDYGRRYRSRFISFCRRNNVRPLYTYLVVASLIFAFVVILYVLLLIVKKLISAD